MNLPVAQVSMDSERKRSILGRLVEWFWRGAARARASQAFPAPSERASELERRARDAADAALSSTPTEEEPHENANGAFTCEFYRQSVYWMLCARLPDPEASGTAYDPAVWNALDEQTLDQAGVPIERRERLLSSLRDGSFVYFAELPAEELLVARKQLREFAGSLLARSSPRASALATVYLQRSVRLGLLVVGFGLALASFFLLRGVLDERRDLALGKAWRTSSRYQVPGCVSPAQQCAESPDYFFCTNDDESPWIEFDLGAPLEFSSVLVENRVAVPERAVPLAVEVSEDHHKWRVVATKEATFSTWRATFSPVKSRWVRLRVQKRSWLHLVRVRILP